LTRRRAPAVWTLTRPTADATFALAAGAAFAWTAKMKAEAARRAAMRR